MVEHHSSKMGISVRLRKKGHKIKKKSKKKDKKQRRRLRTVKKKIKELCLPSTIPKGL